MLTNSSKNLSLFHILDGLRQGLSSFSGPSRAAVIYAEKPDDPVSIYDPQDLLRGHEPMLKEIYLDNHKWRSEAAVTTGIKNPAQIFPEKNLELSGLISSGARTRLHLLSDVVYGTPPGHLLHRTDGTLARTCSLPSIPGFHH